MKSLTILQRAQISPVSPKGVQNRAGEGLQLGPGKHKVICMGITHGQGQLRLISRCSAAGMNDQRHSG